MKSKAKYLEVVNFVKVKIENGELKTGDKMYSENVLSGMFKMSRQTIRHAMEVLEKEGLISRVRGSGTYIGLAERFSKIGKTSIAVVTTYVDSYIFPKTIKGIETVLSSAGYSVQIAFTNNTVEKEHTILKDIIVKDEVAGIIIEPTKSGLPNPNISLYQTLIKKGVPIIFINSFYPGLKLPHVSMNDKEIAKHATIQLIEAGHRKIGGIFKLDDGQGHLRYAGYMEAMEEADLPTNDINVVWLDSEEARSLKISKEKILERTKNCTALLCYNDQIAFNMIELFQRNNIKVPDQMSIISIDNSELSVLGDVQITSVPHPMDELGTKAAGNLIRMIQNPLFDGTYEFMKTVVNRASIKRL